MPKPCLDLDILVLGAGPAGITAALRLQQWGYRVAVVERQAWPREHIGESLTPGVHNILALLDASQVLAQVPMLSDLPTSLIWASPEPTLSPPQGGGGVMVNRGAFDQALFDLFGARGGHGLASAQVQHVLGEPGAWQVALQGHASVHRVQTRVILDARGRMATQGIRRLATALPLLASWTDTASVTQAVQTRVEALKEGWLWGSPLPGGLYRVMYFGHPSAMRHVVRGNPEMALRHSLSQSRSLAAWAEAPFPSGVQVCAATPYVDEHAWLPGRLKLGDAAFAVDPLSSSGVEKAMRFSLQAAVSVHTMLRDPGDQPLAQRFYQTRLLEGVVRHAFWARRYYQQAWPGAAHAFWHGRGSDVDLGQSVVASEIRQGLQWLTHHDAKAVNAHQLAMSGLDGAISMSTELVYTNEPCVVDDLIQLRPAIAHPNLVRPVAFVEGQALVPLLQILSCVASLSTAIELWAHRMPLHTARRIAGWLLATGLITQHT